jgi:hypothetical protein
LSVHGIEAEVVDDEEFGSEKFSELLLEGLELAGVWNVINGRRPAQRFVSTGSPLSVSDSKTQP